MLRTAKAKYEMMRQWVDQGEVVREYLDADGSNAVCRLMATGISLRGIARKTGLSPTYLSRVKSGDVRISPTSYMQLLRMEMRDNA